MEIPGPVGTLGPLAESCAFQSVPEWGQDGGTVGPGFPGHVPVTFSYRNKIWSLMMRDFDVICILALAFFALPVAVILIF